jgi:succinate dehydrogenase / fumarate reductase cytochrome b subunit
MAASITHRATGIALSAGTVFLAWWLWAASSGFDSGSFQLFARVASWPIAQVVLFGFVWSLLYHFLSGFRHLAWDFGYGFAVKTASGLSVAIYVLSILLTVAAFALVYLGKVGYLQ